MTLGDKQRLFVRLQAQFVLWAYEQGYALTDGDAYRDPRLHGELGEKLGYGHAKSCHKLRLARDYNLFKQVNGSWVYLTRTEDYEPLGRKWESMHELCRWGGRFGDGNHFSFTHDGMK